MKTLPYAIQRALAGLSVAAGLALFVAPTSALAAARPATIFSANFNGPAGSLPNQSIWSFDTGGNWANGQDLEYDTNSPQNASLDGSGDLNINAIKGNYTGSDGVTRSWTSARLETYQKFDFTYGTISARIKVPAGAGLWPQFWAVGDGAYSLNDWPACGEIDTMEMIGSDPFDAYGTIHGPQTGNPNGYHVQGDYHSSTSLAAGYHVYSANWTPNQISFAVDGHTYETITPSNLPSGSSWPFAHPFFLIMDLGVGGPWAGPPNAGTPSHATMSVNWVKVTQTATATTARANRRIHATRKKSHSAHTARSAHQ